MKSPDNSLKTCPICEHWNNLLSNQEIGELQKSQAKVALSNHQYFKHFKEGGIK